MRTILTSLFLIFSGCPHVDPCYYGQCPVTYPRTYGVNMDIVEVQPGAKKTTATVKVVINRPLGYRHRASFSDMPSDTKKSSTNSGERPVEEGEEPYDEEIKLQLHWSCPTLEKSDKVEVIVAEESAEGKVEISNLPPQPLLTIYPWEFKRGLECVLMTEDEKIAQEQTASDASSEDSDEETADEESRDKYRGKRAFFIKKSAPEIKLSKVAMVAGNPDSYIDLKVELLRNEVAVVAGDRSFDLEVEVKLPWSCEGVTPRLTSGDTHIVIPAGASSGEARLIMPAQREVKLTCTIEAKAYIDSFIIGMSAGGLEFAIPKSTSG